MIDFATAAPPANPPWELQGWGLPNETLKHKLRIEALHYEQQASANPQFYTQRPAREWQPEAKKKWDELHAAKGYEAGSCDIRLIDEFVLGRRFNWLPQKTGSCVISNTFRGAVRRILAEIVLKGQLEEPWGSTEFGTSSIAFYAPYSYALGRQKGNIRNGDGSYCEPQIWALQQGVLPCSNGKLGELLHKLGADGEKDFPEPQDNRVYRAWQDWKYNEEFKPFLVTPLRESVLVRDVETLELNAKQLKPTIMCSSVAIKKGPVYKGLQTYVRDPENQWLHNMCWQGVIVWHGKTFDILDNGSWGAENTYAIEQNETADILRRNTTCMTLGEFELTDSAIAA